ncbi:MAG: hypothetical protein ACPGGK_07995 [Pikeienuella sp.]
MDEIYKLLIACRHSLAFCRQFPPQNTRRMAATLDHWVDIEILVNQLDGIE